MMLHKKLRIRRLHFENKSLIESKHLLRSAFMKDMKGKNQIRQHFNKIASEHFDMVKRLLVSII